MSKTENISKAAKYITENPDEALQVLRGEVEPPKGILRNSIFVAMQNSAQGDVDLARKLASLQSTRFGQEISILTEIDPNSPVKIMSDIVNIRRKAFAGRYKGKSASEVSGKVVEDIRSEIKTPTKYDWNTFIESIEC